MPSLILLPVKGEILLYSCFFLECCLHCQSESLQSADAPSTAAGESMLSCSSRVKLPRQSKQVCHVIGYTRNSLSRFLTSVRCTY